MAAGRKQAEKPEYKDRRREYTKRTDVQERRRANERKRYALNPRKHIEKVQKYYAQHSERIKARRRSQHYEDYQSEEVRRSAQERTRKWAQGNPERAKQGSKVQKHKRRARERAAQGAFTAGDVAAIFTWQRGRCALCRRKVGKKYHLDHIIPLSAPNGTNDKRNLQILCAGCNLAKGARDPIDHARSLGMLL